MKTLLVAVLAAFVLSACGPELKALQEYRDFALAPQGQTLLWKRAVCGAYGEVQWQNVYSVAPPPSYDCYGRTIVPTVIPYAPPAVPALVIIDGRIRMPGFGWHHHRH